MAGPNSWETVVHKKKPTANDKKAVRKAFFEKATVVEDVAPLESTDTIYTSAFNKSKPNKPSVTKSKEALAKEAAQAKKDQQKKKKDANKQKKEKSASLEDALKGLSLEDVEKQWNDVRVRCKSAPSLWLGDIVGFLTRKLEVKDSPQMFTGEAADYPCCQLSPKLNKFLSSTLNSYDSKMLKEFFDYCLKEMLTGLNKGQPVYAYRIYIQLLVKKHPEFITKSYKHFRDLIKNRQNERLPCLSLLWTCNLAGLQNQIVALEVWSQLMLPMMSHKMISPYAIQTLEGILGSKLDKQKANEVFGPTEFFPLLDFIFTSNVGLPPNLQKSLMKLYPRLKTIAYGPDPSTSLRKFFPSYLTRITRDCPENYKAELLKGLLYCLATDSRCFSEWRQMYDNHMAQSGILLKHMVSTWTETASMLPRVPFHETIRAFNLTNEEMAASQVGKKNYQDCHQACKFLLEKMEKKFFPWRSVMTGFVIFVLLLFIFDLILHGGFPDSITNLALEKSGIKHVLKQAWSKITLYGGIALSWLVTNVPLYYAKVCELCGPYLSLVVQKLKWMALKVLDLMRPVLVWLQTNIPIAMQWIQSKVPIVLAAVQNNLMLLWAYVSSVCHSISVVVMPYLQEAWEAIAFYTQIFWASIEPAFSSVWVWLKTSVGTT